MKTNKVNWIIEKPEQFEVFINSQEQKLIKIVGGFEITIKAMLQLMTPEGQNKCPALLQNLAKYIDNIYDEHEKALREAGIEEVPATDQGGTSQQQKPYKIIKE